MRQDRFPGWFALLLAAAAGFVVITGLGLPDVVASHFGGSGAPNGAMPRTTYVGFMLVLIVGLPALLVFVTWFTVGKPGARINLPNREYWLAPERRAGTVARLRAAMLQFGALLLAFLCYGHWLVVRANLSQPVRLAHSWFVGGLVVFLVLVLSWSVALVRRFRRVASS